ncbi:MAG TPA: hypothetical protein VGW78_07350 [Candidatus Babeliales bacterium]|nr:hypothetical protein [Candidatus Babeliales bacterium]
MKYIHTIKWLLFDVGIIALSLVNIPIQASDLSSSISSGSTSYVADANFYLKNTIDDYIQIQFYEDGQLISVAPNQTYKDHLSLKEISALSIYYCPTSDYCKNQGPARLMVNLNNLKLDGVVQVTFTKKNGEGEVSIEERPRYAKGYKPKQR